MDDAELRISLREEDALSLRRFRQDDAAEFAHNANRRGVWRNLLGGFPHPYTVDDARGFIALCKAEVAPFPRLAIALDDRVICGIGLVPKDKPFQRCAHFGIFACFGSQTRRPRTPVR